MYDRAFEYYLYDRVVITNLGWPRCRFCVLRTSYPLASEIPPFLNEPIQMTCVYTNAKWVFSLANIEDSYFHWLIFVPPLHFMLILEG